MNSLVSVLRDKYNKSPEEIEDILQHIQQELNAGRTPEEVLIDIFGTDVEYLVNILGGDLHEHT